MIDDCFAANRKWAKTTVEEDPEFFKRLEALQSPDLLWIGCSDSRLPPNEIIGRAPGELFVH
ncbi:MAG: carbonic anhydrase, partial [Deltaproteobacteria bacterium]|nr:carbonic anhydrase [Deltaproteobacteria bacterium]